MSWTRWGCAAAVVAVAVLPVLALTPFPTQDGPAHLYGGHALRHVGAADYPVLSRVFEHSPAAISTWAVHGFVALLLTALSPLWVEKIVVLVFLSSLFAVYGLGARRGLLFPLCALPLFAMSFPLRMGFHSFCLAMPLTLLAVSLWSGAAGVVRRPLVAGGLLAVLPLLHLMAAAWAGALMGVSTLVAMVAGRRIDWRGIAILGVAAIPFLALVAAFPASSAFVWEPLGARLAALMAGGSIIGVGPHALWWSSAAALTLLVLTLLFLRGASFDGAASTRLVLVIAALAIALFAPEEGAGGAYVGVRYNLLFFLLVLLMLRAWRLPRRVDHAMAAVFLLLSVHHVWALVSDLKASSAAQREIFESASVLDDHTTLISVVTGEWVDSGVTLETQVRPILHAGDLLGVGADRAVLTFYEADFPAFPVVFRRDASPFGKLFDQSLFDWGVPAVRWGELASWQGGVDYVGVWGERFLTDSAAGREFERAIGAHYTEVYRSAAWPWVIYRLVRE